MFTLYIKKIKTSKNYTNFMQTLQSKDAPIESTIKKLLK